MPSIRDEIAAKGDKITAEERMDLDLYNREARVLEGSTRLQVPPDLYIQLDNAFEQAMAYYPDRENGDYVSRDIIKSHFESDYMIAYRRILLHQ